MNVMSRTAYYQNRRDEQPNIALAESLAASKDKGGIKEIVAGLRQDNPQIAGDCVKVLYEIGYREPALIAPYVPEFMRLLNSRQNRLVWGGMAALSTVAALKPRETYEGIETILKAFHNGSVITVDNGVTVLAALSQADSRYEKELWPVVIRHLETCRPKELPQHAERASLGINQRNARAFCALLEKRIRQLSPAQQKRIEKLLAMQKVSGKVE